jgi:hypothetical protein
MSKLAQNFWDEENTPYPEPSYEEVEKEQKSSKFNTDEENDFDSTHWDIISD